ncbi:MAG TPA: glycoside hydrolase family 127 protein [bacterium]|nr:glycoside hydrolase family 127 protein [bacterium]HQG45279.1 glycoside hydrolase family 127 protein [bacterium]HQI47186.1 glycoside hydrolase family 127 protein [bacterium]HQJ63515.1 glycoside hydrolase family 127 protein [bacterium]
MRNSYFLLFFGPLLLLTCAQRKARDYPIQPVPFTRVHLEDSFWAPRIEINRTITIPHAFAESEKTGRIANFALAGGLIKGQQQGAYPFDDSDVYKIIEGASYTLAVQKDPKLEAYLDSLITLIAAAQEKDGYLYTARTNKAPYLEEWSGKTRWSHEFMSHELYNAGHLFEAAAAHYQATGKRNLFDVALKYADLICTTFGPGKVEIPPGHQVIEIGLVKLYRITRNDRYLQTARYFLDIRGKATGGRELYGPYSQDHIPIVQQREAVGHAVRAGYMYAGIADVAALTGDQAYLQAIDLIWQNVTRKKIHLTGGIGATSEGEAFGKNYELPNLTAYNETCASIANVYWNYRLFLLHGQSMYLDVLERTLYNGLLSGVALDGTHFFYPNPLESAGQHERKEWFGCACCPGNITRFLASIPGYLYALRDDQLYVNLYAESSAEFELKGQPLQIKQVSAYPWDGQIQLLISPPPRGTRFTLHLRIPGWAQGRPIPGDLYRYVDPAPAPLHLEINGQSFPLEMQEGFARIERTWKPGDWVELTLPMPVRRVVAHDSVAADRGRVALERGPLVYCFEWPDVTTGHVRNLLLPDAAPVTSLWRDDLLNGLEVLQTTVKSYSQKDTGPVQVSDVPAMAIPYYAWAHRGRGEMAVWLAREEDAVHPFGAPEAKPL